MMKTQLQKGRNASGTFALGNTFGKGRPRRAVESEYLAALGNAVTLDTWGEIVKKAVEDAKAGDAKAREWVSRYVLGTEPIGLMALARRELQDITPEVEMAADYEIAHSDAMTLYTKYGNSFDRLHVAEMHKAEQGK